VVQESRWVVDMTMEGWRDTTLKSRKDTLLTPSVISIL
jgi:hypothetical protein